jgi:phosphatidylglycerophosphate synthase
MKNLKSKWLNQNIANIISLFRILLTFPFLFTLYRFFTGENNLIPLSLLFFMIMLSDIFDGYLARKLNCQTKIGESLDVLADSFYSILSLSLLSYLNIIPIWFIAVMIIKLSEFFISSKILNNNKEERFKFLYFDLLGKIMGILFIILPGIICLLQLFLKSYMGIIINILVIVITIIAVISTILRSIEIK